MWACSLATAVLLLAEGADPALTDLDRRVLPALKAVHEAGPVVVHYDPASVPAIEAEAEGARARAALEAIQARLHERLDGPAHLFLYRDAGEFRERTGAPPSWEAFAAGARSLHVPTGAPLRHEITHLLGHRITGSVERDPGGLLREGLATAMEGADQGVPVSSWAAIYMRLGLLPSVKEMRERWPEGRREAHPYHAAGSFVEWLLATEGLVRVKAVYADPSKAGETFGRGWEDLEGDWRKWLAGRVVPSADEDVVRRGMLLPTRRAPPPLAQAPGESLFDGRSLEGWSAPRAGSWSVADGVLRGEGKDGWSMLGTAKRWKGEYSLRATVRVPEGCGVLLRLNHTEESSDEVLMTPQGCSVTLRGGAEGAVRSPVRLEAGRWTDVLVTQEDGTARLYLDGRLLIEASGAFGRPGGAAGLGVTGGVAEVRAVSVVPAAE
jgi:hypothetical protein